MADADLGFPAAANRPSSSARPHCSSPSNVPTTAPTTATAAITASAVPADSAALQEPAQASDAKSESISEVSTLSSASMDEEESWVSSFCNVVGHEYFAEVAEDFIEDDFNLTGLGASVPMCVDANYPFPPSPVPPLSLCPANLASTGTKRPWK